MTKTITYNGVASDWTLAEYKTLLEDLAGFHGTDGQEVRRLTFNVEDDRVAVTVAYTGVATGDVPTTVTALQSFLDGLPNAADWPDAEDEYGVE